MSLQPGNRTGTAFAAPAGDGARIAGTLYAAADGASAGRSGNRLVLVHSLAMDRGFWAPVIDRLPPGVAVAAYDCRGHGASAAASGEPPAAGYAVETFGRDLAAVLDHLGWSDAVVAGASMGGCVCMAFAGLHPERARGLGLFDTTAWYGEEAVEVWEGRARKALTEGPEALVGFQRSRWFTDRFREANPQIVQTCVDVFLRNDPSRYAAACRMMGSADLRPYFPRMTMPVEVIVGEEDYATPPAMAEAIAAGLPQARLRVVSGARHFTPIEAADLSAAALADLVARTAGAGEEP